jgi:hypothetical protein
MKRAIALSSLLWLLCGIAAAQSRNVYGYVMGLGGQTGSISKIIITDMNTGFRHWADGWSWSPFAPGAIRWFKNNLPVNHAYSVDVYSNGFGVKWTAFYLPTGFGDFKAPDVHF